MKLGEKGQGLPIHIIIVLILGLIVLAVILLYIFGVFGAGGKTSGIAFDIGGNISKNASDTTAGFFG